MLDSRKGAILRAIVREYVRAGQPVGSKALTEKLGLAVSAATVRNDMALLEDLGYIRRPHSSAGGVPTDKGYRWFIDNWPGPAWPALPPGPQRAINGAFEHGFHALEEALDMTSQVLSEVTEAVAVVAAPAIDPIRALIAVESQRIVTGSTGERTYRGGTANILTREKFSDLETAGGVVGVLEQPMVLAALLGRAQGEGTMIVLIGQEHP